MTRANLDDGLLRHFASTSGPLFYEMSMLSEAANTFAELQLKGDSSVVANLAIESFLLHYRNLRDFLYPDRKVFRNSDDCIAYDYDSSWSRSDSDWQECAPDERSRINKMLAHLSYSRRNLLRWWPIQEMRMCIMERFHEFVLSLPEERRRWFDDWGLGEALRKAHSH